MNRIAGVGLIGAVLIGLVIAPLAINDAEASHFRVKYLKKVAEKYGIELADKSLTGGDLPITKLIATNTYIVRGETPQGGVDAFSYDGSGHIKIPNGNIWIRTNPVENTGRILAIWTDNEGNEWRYLQTQFSGGNELYYEGFDKDGNAITRLDTDPIAINHFEHGTTGAGPVVEPTLFVYLATWGPAQVWKNGEKLGEFEGHMMVTDGARDPETGIIYNANKTGHYNPMNPGDAWVNHNIAQVHLVFHTPAGEKTNNFPPPYEFFYHLMFYDIIPSLPVTKISASNTYIVRGETPQGGVDAFSYDGSGHIKIPNGNIWIRTNPVENTGRILAIWTDNEGNEWRYLQTQFSGGNELYYEGFDKDGNAITRLDTDPIAINHFEHGTTGAGPVVEPTLFVYLATWGPAQVWKNGEKLGEFEGHMMVTDGARDPETGIIYNANKTGHYNPMNPGDAWVNHNIAQVHLVFHTPAGEKTNNFPPPYEFFYHLMFYDIKVM